MLGNACPRDCSYCFVKGSSTYKVEESNQEAILNSLHNFNTINTISSIEFVGGEPFLYLDLIHEIIKMSLVLNPKMTFSVFTSGTVNVSDFVSRFSEFKDIFSVFVSFDGSLSKRNKLNCSEVKRSLLSIKHYFNTNVRFSIIPQDINFIGSNLQELAELGILNPIFFPMKYSDYTEEEISSFSKQWSLFLSYCVENGINFLGVLNDDKEIQISRKDDFTCETEVTILPSGKFSECYVKLSSSDNDPSLIYDNLSEFLVNKGSGIIPHHHGCEDCLEIFGSCNLCPGNLIEYRKKTGKLHYLSYCSLMHNLSLIYIKTRLLFNPSQKFSVIYKQKLKRILISHSGVVYSLPVEDSSVIPID